MTCDACGGRIRYVGIVVPRNLLGPRRYRFACDRCGWEVVEGAGGPHEGLIPARTPHELYFRAAMDAVAGPGWRVARSPGVPFGFVATRGDVEVRVILTDHGWGYGWQLDGPPQITRALRPLCTE